MSTPDHAFKANPPSLYADNREMLAYYSNQDPSRPTPHTAPSITPYLGLRARLSQIWINRWTILLLLVLARTLIAISGIHNDLGSARREALSACSGVEDMGSAMASMPHFMSQGVNEMAATGVEKAVNGLMEMSMLTVTGVEELVLFIINMFTQTYLCLITLAVGGSLHVAIQVVEDAEKFLNQTLGNIGGDISKSLGTFEDAWNKFLGTLNSGLNDIFGKQIKPPSLDLNASMDALSHLALPGNLDEGLNKLNQSIPTFADVNNFTSNAIRLPFEELKNLINSSMVDYKFDRSVFPVPAKQKLTFCSGNNGINDFFDDLTKIADTAKKVFIVVLLLAAIAACIPMAWREIKRWRTMQERSQLVRSTAHDPMDVVYIVSRPYTATAGIKTASRFKSTRNQILTRWVFAYATSTPVLFVLSLGVAGLFSCVCQAILLKALEKEVPQLSNQVGAFADKVVTSLNNASEQWAIDTNSVISSTNKDINDKMLGWVNTSTTAVNDTLNTFVDGVTGVLNTTFHGTVLEQPILDVLNCLILLKIQGIQKGLTWVHDHAHIDFPLLPNDTFSLGAAESIAPNSSKSASFLAAPGNTTSDQISEAVLRLTNNLEEGIQTEAKIATGLVCVWLFILLIAVIRAMTLWFSPHKVRGEGGTDDASTADDRNNVPLTIVTEPPKYDHVREYFHQRDDSQASENDYQSQKLGFAGQRDYLASVRPEDMKSAHVRNSSYGELLGDADAKR